MWILIDNYDSFTHILHHYLLLTGNNCVVYRNDEISIAELEALAPERIILSPGPETPLQAGITMEVIHHFHDKIPILGICLGHQAIGMYFGAQLAQLSYPMHGKTSAIYHTDAAPFKGLPKPFTAMRYHSLHIQAIEGTGIESLAHTEDGIHMAIQHTTYPCVGIQFHPESVGTQEGLQILKNWAAMTW